MIEAKYPTIDYVSQGRFSNCAALTAAEIVIVYHLLYVNMIGSGNQPEYIIISIPS